MARIVGVDEVGRGCWAGPLVAAAVIFDETVQINSKSIVGNLTKITDSKKMTKNQRNFAEIYILKNALAYGIGWVDAQEVDRLGLTGAVRLAMQLAIDQIKIDFDQIIIDGNYNFLAKDPRSSTLVKADELLPSVSAASILAKVARDKYMLKAAKIHPGYGFEKHVGYGTKLHIEKLRILGPCKLHRMSYKPLKSLKAL